MARRNAVAVALAVLAVPALACAQAPRAPTLSKTQARALPPTEVTARVMDQLGDLLVLAPQPSPTGRKPVRPLRDLNFSTVPRATYVPGVCARDDVIVTFEEAYDESRAVGPDTPVRASSLSAQTRYRLLGPPAKEIDNYGAPPPASAHQDCARLGQDKTATFFNAPTAEVALRGVWWLTRLKSAPGAAPIDCKLTGPAPSACGPVLGRLTRDDLQSVEPCPSDPRDTAPLNCWALSLWPEEGLYNLQIFTTRGPHAAIARVELVEMVYVSEETGD